MEKHVEKEQSMATKLALLLIASFMLIIGILGASIGAVDKVWEHTLSMCIALLSIPVFDAIEDKKQFVKDIKDLFK